MGVMPDEARKYMILTGGEAKLGAWGHEQQNQGRAKRPRLHRQRPMILSTTTAGKGARGRATEASVTKLSGQVGGCNESVTVVSNVVFGSDEFNITEILRL